ncbi:MAG: DUF4411 family protein [Acidobacteria bacterium]|jgi:hypothetical protein|nr:DUF4411 family protein [Acidobacteriota bacterium]
MENSIQEGVMIAPEIVLEELKRKEDDLYEWAKDQKKLFIPLLEEIQLIQIDIINTYPKLIDSSKNRSMCDPWVIALAQHERCKVVTEENRGNDKRPKIPDVCDSLGIRCLRIADLIEELNWTF